MRDNLTPNANRITVPVPYPEGVVAGQCIVVGALFGVALSTAAHNQPVEIAVDGVFQIAKQPGLAIADGARVFWDAANRWITTSAAGNFHVGIAWGAAASADANVRITLQRVPPAGDGDNPPPSDSITINALSNTYPADLSIPVSGTYTGSPSNITVVWRQNGANVGSPVNVSDIAGGAWSGNITTPATPGVYTLRAAFNGTTPIAESDPVTIEVADGITINTPSSPQTAGASVAVSGTYAGSPTSITVVWRQNGANVGSPVTVPNVSGGNWSGTIDAPASPGTYTLRAAFNGATPTADSGSVTIEVASSITITTPVSPQPTDSPLVVSGSYTGSPTSITVVWRQGGADVGSPFTMSNISGGAWSGTVTTPAAEGTYTLRAAFNGTSPIADSNTVTIEEPQQSSLLETVTMDNFSGASRTDPYISIARNFVEGDVPSGSRVELRYNGSPIALQQADGFTYNSDGSLRRAVFAFKPIATVANNATIDVEFHVVSGSFNNSSTISRSTLTAQDYRMRLRIDGVDYWCVLNNLDAAGTFRERRVGPVVRAWHHWGVFRQGTGPSDTDQGQWQGHFYSYVWEDGTITVFPYAINGRVANSQSYTVEEFELLNGNTSIIAHTTSFTAYGWSAYFLCTADGQPHWSANAAHFHPRATWRWFHDRKLIWNTYDSATLRANVPVPAALSYSPNSPAGAFGGSGINSGGASAWIGDIPDWDAHVLLATSGTEKSAADRATLLRNSRVNALAMGVKFPGWLVRHESGHPPVLVNQDYTANGLTTAQTSVGWGSAATITRTGGEFAGAVNDASHMPQYATYQAMVTGWEWWQDMMVILGVGCIGRENPANTVNYSRRPLLNGQSRDCGTMMHDQHRTNAWRHKSVCDAEWLMPDTHPCKAYFGKLMENGFAIAEQFLTAPQYSTEKSYLGVWGSVYGGLGATEPLGFGPWQAHGYFVPTMCMSIWRGRITTSHKLVAEHITKQLFGVINACPYRGSGLYGCSLRVGPQPTTASPYATSWDEVYCSYSSAEAAGQTMKLISDTGGSSGACPSSGLGQTMTGGHSYPNLARRACEVGAMVGIEAASVSLTYLRNEEAAAGITDASRAPKPQWGTRAPS